MNSAMLVSIITPTYNRADLLPETIESILSQDYPQIEYLVLDDGSSDNTAGSCWRVTPAAFASIATPTWARHAR